MRNREMLTTTLVLLMLLFTVDMWGPLAWNLLGGK